MSNITSYLDQGYKKKTIFNPYDGSEIGTVADIPATAAHILIETAKLGATISRSLSRAQRAYILEKSASLVEADKEGFAATIVAESGKTIKQAKKEVLRCINTLKLSAEEAKRNAGEIIPFDSYVGSESRQGWFTREPLGVILAITPYNDPLNLVAHKLGPAIAGGNAIILKPSELTPLSAIKLVECLKKAGLPMEVVTIATGNVELSKSLVTSREVRMISFTGGFSTGEDITRLAGLKKMAMDLGGNAPVIVMNDCDIASTVESCISGSYWAAGQNCIGTQRILIDARVYDKFKSLFIEKSRTLIVGDPSCEATDVGPMITEMAAIRAQEIVTEAIQQGAKLLLGNKREGSLYYPTILENVNHSSRVWIEEVFSPVVVLQPINSLDDALTLANNTEFSLHAGIFTNNLSLAMKAAKLIEAGGIMINDSSDYRFDAMPFGGFKYGSMGREGVRFAFEDMTQPKVVCINGT